MSKQITSFTRANLKEIRKELDAALEAALAKHGLSGKLGNIKFSDNDFRCQLSVMTGTNDDAAEREFRKHAHAFGLTGDEFGKSIRQGWATYQIVGIKPRSYKYPILAKNPTGTIFKFPADAARTAV